MSTYSREQILDRLQTATLAMCAAINDGTDETTHMASARRWARELRASGVPRTKIRHLLRLIGLLAHDNVEPQFKRLANREIYRLKRDMCATEARETDPNPNRSMTEET